jgi:hypothetical protein
MSATHGGKGSQTRPTDKQKYDDNWDRIFGKKSVPSIGEEMNKLELINLLHNNVANITFTKVNGDVRTLKGTLMESIVPKKEMDPAGVGVETIVETQARKATNENVVVVWDIENDGYRSFRVDSVTAVEIIEN